jgi:tetratricopeptide (TPR) repeat protein
MSARTELNTLEASGLVQVAAFEPDLEYLFRHALVQDAAYSSLLKQDRLTLHRLAAETLLSLYPDRRRELAAVIGLHFERAGDPAAAVEHLVVAGEHALERFANREALAFFERAEASLAPEDPRFELRLRAALGAAKVGWTFVGPDRSIERLEQAVAVAPEETDRPMLGDAYFWIAFLRRMRGERPDSSPELAAAVDRAASIGGAGGDELAQAIPTAFLALGMMFVGHIREGAESLERALGPITARGDRLSAAILTGLLSIGQSRLGDFAGAERTLARADDLARSGDPIAVLDAQIARSGLHIERGEIDVGEALATACAIKSEELGAVACSVAANVMAGTAHLAREDALGAKAPLERGDELADLSSMTQFRTLAQGMLGSVRSLLSESGLGTTEWEAALARALQMHDRYGESITLWMRARARMSATPPDHTAALVDLGAATRLFEEMEARPSLARALRDQAHALRSLGRAADADATARRSRAIGAQLGLKDFA